MFEIDFAAQLEKKRSLLVDAGVSGLERIERIGCDFTAPDFEETLPVALAEHGFRAGAGAIFVWEGVVPYIGRVAIDRSPRLMAGHRWGREPRRLRLQRRALRSGHGRGSDRVAPASRHFEDFGCDAIWHRYLPGDPPEHLSTRRFGVARARGAKDAAASDAP